MSYINNLFSLKNRVAVVTGGTSGIGFMIAEAFVKAGATTYVTSRKADECQRVAADLSECGVCHPLPGDIMSQQGCEAIATAFRESESQLHVLVNGAGCTWGAPIREYPDKAWDKVMGVNVKGAFQLCVALLSELEAGASADYPSRVINIGSVHGIAAPEWESYAYSASKAAIHQLTVHMAKRLGKEHILVNAIAPGPFPSRMMDKLIEAEGEGLVAETATGRLGIAEDMAGVSIYLASRASSNITGAIIPVDGGYVTTR
tara:strand:- start:326 stop:1105 length:780 start_codon:yes stop_codon:yes gene_type:complete